MELEGQVINFDQLMICNNCCTIKAIDQFAKKKAIKRQRRATCKECIAQQNKDKYAKHGKEIYQKRKAREAKQKAQLN